jgi:chromosome segregation ATPase
LIKDLPTHARVVTLLGEVFRGDGLIIAGKSASSFALSRPRQKRELTESLTALSAQIESLNNEVDLLSAQIADAQREITGAESAVRETRIRLDEAKGYEKQAGLESESTLRQLEWQKSQHVTLKADADEVASIRMNLIEMQIQVETESAKV